MKWLIINTEAFSTRCVDTDGKPRPATVNDLPKVIRVFLKVFPFPFIILDECSKIKTNTPMEEKNKSLRTQLIKQLEPFGHRCILTGTLNSKSPINVVDPYRFLHHTFFEENIYEFAERYCIMETIRIGRGRRIIISQKDYMTIRNRMKNAYIRGGKDQLERTKESIFKEYTIDYKKLDWIIAHRKYTPYIRHAELMKRIAPVSVFVKRSDVFDTKFDRFITDPIMRPVEISDKAKRIASELIELGFSDHMTLGRAPALELQHRLQDICNGFEPMRDEDTYAVSYTPFPSNPKMESLIDLLEEIGCPETQAVIWSSRVNMLEAIKDRLDKEGISCVTYYGSDSTEEKAAAEKAFERKEASVFLANQASAAYGLNGLKNCDYEIVMCVDGSVERCHQAMFRLLRGKLRRPKFAYHIYVRGSMEERMIRCIQVGEELIGSTNSKEKFEFF